MSEEELQKFSLDLPKELHKKLKQFCIDNDKKMKEVLIEALEKSLQ